jgi:hypothetical protein
MIVSPSMNHFIDGRPPSRSWHLPVSSIHFSGFPHMRTLLFPLLTILIVGSIASSQEITPRTSAGSKALMFSVNGFGAFGVHGSYAGSQPLTTLGLDTLFNMHLTSPIFGFGMRWYLANNTALRVSLGGASGTSYTPRPGDTTGETDDVTDIYLGIAPALEFHIVNSGPLTVYTGGMLNYSTNLHANGTDSDDPKGTSTKKTYSTFGGGAILGAEYFPWRSVSFGAEYQLTGAWTSSSTQHKGVTTDGNSYFDLGISSVAVALSVYF